MGFLQSDVWWEVPSITRKAAPWSWWGRSLTGVIGTKTTYNRHNISFCVCPIDIMRCSDR